MTSDSLTARALKFLRTAVASCSFDIRRSFVLRAMVGEYLPMPPPRMAWPRGFLKADGASRRCDAR